METNNNTHVCPWWMGYALLIPFRKYYHNPERILSPYIKPGMIVMDYGSAMGYFSIPLAKIVGDNGMVYCVDLQDKMLSTLKKRAARYNVSNIIRPLKVGGNYNVPELQDTLDFVLLFYVAHEVPDQAGLFKDLHTMLKPGGKILFAEPKGHVMRQDFNRSLNLAQHAGLEVIHKNTDIKGLSVTLQKP